MAVNTVQYGFTALKDIMNLRATQASTPVINDAIDRTLQEHERQMAALLALFVEKTTEGQRVYQTGGVRRLQPMDEHGRARPTKSGAKYQVGLPLQIAGDALGLTYDARAKMTVQEVNNEIAAMMMGDMRWVRDHILSAIFTNVTWTFADENQPLVPSVIVQPLANNDAVTYSLLSGADAPTIDTHYFAQAAAIADGTNPYPTIYSELSEHAENAGAVIALIPTGLKATTQALATFVETVRPEVIPGANTARLVGGLSVPVPGNLIGFEDSGVWIVEWPPLPANYIIGVTAEGAPPLGMREEPEAELQGFKRVAERQDHPYYESQYRRKAGFGAWNRVGALAYRIGNASYAIPTGYAAPMA